MENKKHIKALVSVVVPVYKVEKEIKRCLRSIINQTYDNLEIILVDDGSPDSCGQICDEFAKTDKRIKVIHKNNGGLSDARNFGIKASSGEFITFVDSDDFIKPDCIEKLYNAIIKNKCDIAICSHEDIYPDRVKRYPFSKKYKYETVMKKEEALEHMLYKDGYDVSAWAKLYNTNLFDNISYPKGRLFEDAATTYKLIIASEKIVYINYIGYEYVMRKDSIVNTQFTEKKIDLITSTNEMCDEIDFLFPDLRKATIRRRVYANFSTLRLMGKVYTNYIRETNQIINTINLYKKDILLDKDAPIRDKFAVLTLKLGKGFFFGAWNFYAKFTGRS